MLSQRIRLSAIALFVAIFVTTTAPMLAAAPAHPVCTTKQHDCGKTAALTRCCCGEQTNTDDQGGPIESRVQLAGVHAIAGPTVAVIAVTNPVVTNAHVHTSPPRASPLDLLTLFSTLLI